MAQFEGEGQLTQLRVRPAGIFFLFGEMATGLALCCPRWCVRMCVCACPPAMPARSLPVPSPVISCQSAGPDAPDPVNDMLRGLAGEGFQVQRDTTPHLRKLRGRVSQRLGLAQNPADCGERKRCKV